jgi:hypothetical protein
MPVMVAESVQRAGVALNWVHDSDADHRCPNHQKTIWHFISVVLTVQIVLKKIIGRVNKKSSSLVTFGSELCMRWAGMCWLDWAFCALK